MERVICEKKSVASSAEDMLMLLVVFNKQVLNTLMLKLDK